VNTSLPAEDIGSAVRIRCGLQPVGSESAGNLERIPGLFNKSDARVIQPIQVAQDSLMTPERRSYARTNLRVPLFLLPMGSSVPIRTETENVGIDGLFCYVRHLLSPGDRVRFLLFLPAAARVPQSEKGMCVHGEVQVVRVTVGPSQYTYGVGCRLTSYRVLPKSDALTFEEVLNTVFDMGRRHADPWDC
jgi:hypothetical protein